MSDYPDDLIKIIAGDYERCTVCLDFIDGICNRECVPIIEKDFEGRCTRYCVDAEDEILEGAEWME